jgi:hypothetical protein
MFRSTMVIFSKMLIKGKIIFSNYVRYLEIKI